MTLEAPQNRVCAVVTDACCDLPSDVLSRLGVRCCSAAPTPAELSEIYSSLSEQGVEQIVSVHARGAVAAARAVADECGNVTVMDTRLTSIALALVVERAAFAASCGKPADEVAALAEAVAAKTVLYVISDPDAPRQGSGGMRDRLAYLRRRALGTRHLVRVTADHHKVLGESAELSGLAGRIAQACGTSARTEGALCYIEAASENPHSAAALEKPFDTNEYVSFRLCKISPASMFAHYAGHDAIGIAVVPESVYGGHETSLFPL